MVSGHNPTMAFTEADLQFENLNQVKRTVNFYNNVLGSSLLLHGSCLKIAFSQVRHCVRYSDKETFIEDCEKHAKYYKHLSETPQSPCTNKM